MADLRNATAPHRRDGTRGGAPVGTPHAHDAADICTGADANANANADTGTEIETDTDMETGTGTGTDAAADAGAIEEIASALQAVMTVLKQSRLHDSLLVAAGVDLDRARIALLYVLYHSGGHLRIADLAEWLRVDAPAVSRTAARLERAGLVSRSADDEDRRACRLDLSVAGHAAIDATLRARRAWLDSVLGDWTPAERAGFARALHRFADGVDRHLDLGPGGA
jgi:DNA-binding MarR family transcriptional regulator